MLRQFASLGFVAMHRQHFVRSLRTSDLISLLLVQPPICLVLTQHEQRELAKQVLRDNIQYPYFLFIPYNQKLFIMTSQNRLTFLSQAARGRVGIAFYLLTAVLLVAGNVLGSIPITVIVAVKAFNKQLTPEQLQNMGQSMSGLGIDTNLLYALMLLPFTTTILGLWVGVKWAHQRPFGTLINQSGAVRWERFWYSFGLWFGITAAMELVNYALHPADYSWVFQPVPFLITLAISLVLLPLQTSCEELIFRGWLMQGIGSLRVKRWIPLVITSFLFGSMHFANPEVTRYGLALMTVYYIGFGLLLGLITILDDGLDLALGLHFANNLYGAVMVSFTSSALQTNTLLRSPDPDMNIMLPIAIAGSVAAFLVLQKRFGFAPISVLNAEQTPEMK